MHDIDRALFEDEAEGESWGEVNHAPSSFEQEHDLEFDAGESFGKIDSAETWGEVSGAGNDVALAAELLAVSGEDELDQFLGNLVKRAVSAGKAFANSSAGKAVGGILKSAAKSALPRLGHIVGDYISPGAGGNVGKSVGTWIGSKLEAEFSFEGASPEDSELQAARAFVNFARSTARNAAATPTTVPGPVAAKNAAIAAAKQQLGSLSTTPAPRSGSAGSAGQSGRWVRRGRNIVILGVG